MKLLFIAALCLSLNAIAQDSIRVHVAAKATGHLDIDGQLLEADWKQLPPSDDFVMNRPIEGGKTTYRSEFRILFDNKAVYIGAQLYDDHPDSILGELGNRDDQNLNADYFRFVIDPYNLRQDAYDFGVYFSGVQADSRFSDETFNAVWESATSVNSLGWCVEMKIPYSAIRFPKKDIQQWGLQVVRYIRRTREYDQWALTPSSAANSQVYWGTLNGIEHIDAPVRLSLTPYASAYIERSPDYISETEYKYGNALSYNAGADIKYGIDDRFTLDMTLFPDFGQVQSDNKIKNLGYVETVYNENRSFFKEGTELFSKNNLFYSRRIGKTPGLFYAVQDSLNEGETIKSNPSQVKLLNAFKISGRNNQGIGIGLFNAVTDNTYTTIQNENGTERKVLTEPLTNFNILVLDKQINNFSNVYVINTNVSRNHNYGAANVTGAGFTLADKSNKYAIDGSGAYSQQFLDAGDGNVNSRTVTGYKYFVGARKISGRDQFGISQTVLNATYQQTDMGFYSINDIMRYRVYYTRFQFQPWKFLRESNVQLTMDYSQNFNTHERTGLQFSVDGFATLLSYHSFFGGAGYVPTVNYDYYEPRVPGRFNKTIKYFYVYGGISSDYRKNLALDLTLNISNFIDRFVGEGYNVNSLLRYRFSDHFTLSYIFNFNYDPYNLGAADWYSDPDHTIYGTRIMHTYENTLSGKYIFKNDMSLTLNMRHYWSTGKYRCYYELQENGDLIDDASYPWNNDFNYNAFNVDMVYSWQFAPGSLLSFVYKNAVETQDNILSWTYSENFKNTMRAPQTNSLSLRLVYYLDYLSLKKKD